MPAFFYIFLLLAGVCLPARAEHRQADNDFEDRQPAAALETIVRRGRGADAASPPAAESKGDAKAEGAKGTEDAKTEEQKAQEKSKADAAKVTELKGKEGTPSADDVKDLNKFIDELSKSPKDAYSEQRLAQIRELTELRSNWFSQQNQADLARIPPPGISTPAAPPSPTASVQNASPPTPQTTQIQAIAIFSLPPPPPPPPAPAPPAPPSAPPPAANSISPYQAPPSAPAAPLAPIAKSIPASNSAGSNSPGVSASVQPAAPESLPIFRSSTTGATPPAVFSNTLPAAPAPPPPPPPAAPSAPMEPSLPVIASEPPPPPPPAPEPMQISVTPQTALVVPAPPAFPTANQATERGSLPLPSNGQTSFSPIPTESTVSASAPPPAPVARESEYERIERAVRAEPITNPEPEPPSNSRPTTRDLAALPGGYNPPVDLDPITPANATSISPVEPGPTGITPMPPLTISASPPKASDSLSASLLKDLEDLGDIVTRAIKDKEKKIENKLTDLTSFLRANPPRR